MKIFLDSLASTFVGTVAYWPPERFKANEKLEVVSLDEAKVPYDVRSDIWSLGITLTETVYGKLPFLDEKGKTFDTANNVNMISPNIVAVQNAIKIADPDKIIERCFGNAYSSECTQFIRSCLEKVENRPKYAALMEKPFYYKSKASVGQEEFEEFIRVYEVGFIFTLKIKDIFRKLLECKMLDSIIKYTGWRTKNRALKKF